MQLHKNVERLSQGQPRCWGNCCRTCLPGDLAKQKQRCLETSRTVFLESLDSQSYVHSRLTIRRHGPLLSSTVHCPRMDLKAPLGQSPLSSTQKCSMREQGADPPGAPFRRHCRKQRQRLHNDRNLGALMHQVKPLPGSRLEQGRSQSQAPGFCDRERPRAPNFKDRIMMPVNINVQLTVHFRFHKHSEIKGHMRACASESTSTINVRMLTGVSSWSLSHAN